jgi:hypothetical protein
VALDELRDANGSKDGVAALDAEDAAGAVADRAADNGDCADGYAAEEDAEADTAAVVAKTGVGCIKELVGPGAAPLEEVLGTRDPVKEPMEASGDCAENG